MNRQARMAVLVVLAAAALSGCMRSTAEFTLRSDDTVDGAYVFAVEEGMGESLGVSDRELAEDLYADSGLGDTLTDPRQGNYKSDGFVGTRITFGNEPLSEFAPTAERFGMVRDGDEFVVSGPSSAASADDAELLEGADLRVSVTFPGPVTEHNGTLDGTTVTWNLVGGPATLEARGSAIGQSSPTPVLLGGALAIVIAAAWLWHRVGVSSTPAQPRGLRAPEPRGAAPASARRRPSTRAPQRPAPQRTPQQGPGQGNRRPPMPPRPRP